MSSADFSRQVAHLQTLRNTLSEQIEPGSATTPPSNASVPASWRKRCAAITKA
jgi:hypothetical protein